MTEPPDTQSNAAVVENFLHALRDKDFDTFESLAAHDLLYENAGYTRLRGGRRIARIFRGLDRPSAGFDVTFHRNVAEGDIVINERTDALILGPVRAVFKVCGVFEVRDGRVTLWRDYVDMVYFVGAVLRGLLGAVIPPLRASL